MKVYHQINRYLLENFPTLWNTRFVWMVLSGIVLHVLYFTFGYLNLDIEGMQFYTIRSSFFNQSLFGLYLIACLVALIYFGFKYYTHNPFRNFYPIDHFYFWKIFIQLCIIVFVFTTVNVSYESGMKTKLAKIFPKEVREKVRNDINMAYPFLFTDISDYRIENRSYPNPFPLDELSDFVVGYDTVNGISQYHGIDESKPYINFNGNLYQFGEKEMIDIDSCRTKEVIKSYTDVSSVYGLAEYSLFNFSRLYIQAEVPSGVSIFDRRNYDYDQTQSIDNEYNTIAPQIHQMYRNKDVQAVEKTIANLISICKQYGINHTLDAHKIAATVIQQDLNTQTLIHTGMFDYKEMNGENGVTYAPVAEGAAMAEVAVARASKGNIEYNYYADLPKLSNMITNANTLDNDMGVKYLRTDFVWFWIIFSMSFAFVLIITKYVHFKEILIGAVIAGILCAFFGVVSFLGFFSFNRSDDSGFIAFGIFYLMAIISVGIYFMTVKNANKSFAMKWFIPMTSAILLILPLIYGYIYEICKYEVKEKCSDYSSFHHYFDPHPLHILGLELIAIGIIFALLRKIHAKAA